MQGQHDPRFSAVREAFAANFAQRGEVGAAVCVYVSGKPVVDLWGGHADGARSRPWQRDTIVNVASVTKGIVALCAHILASRGLLDFDAPVARYWPEFAQQGKGQLPVRWLLGHRAGLPAILQDMPPESTYDWPSFTSALAATPPWWEPGSQHGYHARTFGHLVGEVVRRIGGKSVGRFLHSEVTGPLAADFYIGVPESEDHRAAETLAPPPAGDAMSNSPPPDPMSMPARAFSNPGRGPEVVNTRRWRAAEIPSVNGHCTARALARIYGALACASSPSGTHILHPSALKEALVEQSCGLDAVLAIPSRFGLGFMLPLAEHFRRAGIGGQPFGPNPGAFGHWGAGGSVGFADPESGVGFAYVMNQHKTGTPADPDLRWPSLVEAVFAALR